MKGQTYDKNNNPIKKDFNIEQDAKWRQEALEWFNKKYGAWYYFTSVPVLKRKSWIEQFRKEYRLIEQ
tara:strand:- start:17619 stop:17822 length:204 start_codon:yes stop_codon:yes gene_type:complete